MEADRELKTAMEEGSKGACLALDMNFTTDDAQTELRRILQKVQNILPHTTPQRVLISNGWLILCTLMVVKLSF